MRREFDKTEYDGEVRLENRGCRGETNQHEEMEMSVEASEIISQTLNKVYTVPLLCIKNMYYVTSGATPGAVLRHTTTFYQEFYNLIGKEKCQHIS